jgi:hypothetical protein
VAYEELMNSPEGRRGFLILGIEIVILGLFGLGVCFSGFFRSIRFNRRPQP